MDVQYLSLIRSSRVTKKTHEVLLRRALPADPGYAPKAISPLSFAVLRAIVQRLIPQADDREFVHIAAMLDARRSAGSGDGWRYASMPPDGEALTLGLEFIETAARLHDSSFASLDHADQDALLMQVQKGEVNWPKLDAARWFEDLLAELTEIYVSHPATLAAMGFSGIAFLPRWPQIGLNTAQPWEPHAMSHKNAPIRNI